MITFSFNGCTLPNVSQPCSPVFFAFFFFLFSFLFFTRLDSNSFPSYRRNFGIDLCTGQVAGINNPWFRTSIIYSPARIQTVTLICPEESIIVLVGWTSRSLAEYLGVVCRSIGKLFFNGSNGLNRGCVYTGIRDVFRGIVKSSIASIDDDGLTVWSRRRFTFEWFHR